MQGSHDSTVQLDILGYVRCEAKTVADVPSEGLPGTLALHDWLEPALEGLRPGLFVYVITSFHQGDRHTFLASPGTTQQRGAFALRSSDRPNCMGMTLTRIEQIRGTEVDVSWVDFSDGTPILDIKVYSNRWECVFSAPGDDRRHFEKQIPRSALMIVLARPIRNFAGNIPEAALLAAAGAELIQEHDVFLHDPQLKMHIKGSGTLVDGLQGLTKASFGNGRLSVELAPTAQFGGSVKLSRGQDTWMIEVSSEGYTIGRN
ncbi:MAG: TrmO family methyltransferase [Chloroflexales bacterium]